MEPINLASRWDDHVLPPAARRLVGSLTGLVRSLSVSTRQRSAPGVSVAEAVETDVSRLANTRDDPLNAGGRSLDRQSALTSAVGETAERYALYWAEPDELVEATYHEIRDRGPDVIDFAHLDVYDDEQLAQSPVQRFERDTVIWWAEGTNVLTGEPCFVPAELVYANATRDESYFVSTSNGMACAPTLADALVGAIEEAIERDGFMHTWFTGRTPERVDLDAFPKLGALKRDRFGTDVLSFVPLRYETLTDHVALGCAVVSEERSGPRFALAGGGSLRPRRAIEDALVEAAQLWVLLKRRYADDDVDVSGDRLTMNDNAVYYSRPEHFGEVAHLLDGDFVSLERAEFVSDGLEPHLDALERAGLTPVAFDLTPPDVGGVGWRVVKVFVPELLGLGLPSLVPVDHPRLAGHEPVEKPHPFV